MLNKINISGQDCLSLHIAQQPQQCNFLLKYKKKLKCGSCQKFTLQTTDAIVNLINFFISVEVSFPNWKSLTSTVKETDKW